MWTAKALDCPVLQGLGLDDSAVHIDDLFPIKKMVDVDRLNCKALDCPVSQSLTQRSTSTILDCPVLQGLGSDDSAVHIYHLFPIKKMVDVDRQGF
jgi:hypothetical protein